MSPCICGLLSGALALVGITATFVNAADRILWKPEKTIELVVPGGAGGGIDNTARVFQNLVQTQRLVEVPIVVVNKPGGGASVGLNYITQQPADGLHIAIGSGALLTNHITGKSKLNYHDFTPLAFLFTEAISLSVRAGSEIKSGKDLLDRMRMDPSGVSFGLPSVASTNHLTCALIAKALGQDPKRLRTVIFNSSNEGITAAMGGHLDVVVAPLGNTIPHVKRGTLRVLAISASKRATGELSNTPTLLELGVQVTTGAHRNVLGPKGMSEDAVTYWERVITKLIATKEWQEYLRKNSWEDDYINSKDSAKYLQQQYSEFREILTDLGLVGKSK